MGVQKELIWKTLLPLPDACATLFVFGTAREPNPTESDVIFALFCRFSRGNEVVR